MKPCVLVGAAWSGCAGQVVIGVRAAGQVAAVAT